MANLMVPFDYSINDFDEIDNDYYDINHNASSFADFTGLSFYSFWCTDSKRDIACVLSKPKIHYYPYSDVEVTERQMGIRPMINYNEIKDEARIIKKSSLLKSFRIQYGEYPQSVVTKKDKEYAELEKAFKKGNLEKTGKVYTVDGTQFYNYFLGEIDEKSSKSTFEPLVYEEYTYNGQKYIRAIANNNAMISGEYKHNQPYWFKVEPIEWTVVDGKAYADKILVAGIQFCSYGSKTEPANRILGYDFSNMNMFLENYMSKEIISTKEYVNEDSNELEILVHKIKKIIKYYSDKIDNPNFKALEADINTNLDKLIKDYNNNVDKYIENANGNTFGLKEPKVLELELKTKLEDYLDKLNRYVLSASVYYKMIDILSLNETNETRNDSLYSILKTIEKVIIPYLSGEEIVEEYRKFIQNEIKLLKEKCDNCENDNFDSLKNNFSKKLSSILTKLKVAVDNKSYINDLLENAHVDRNLDSRQRQDNLFDTLKQEMKNLEESITSEGNEKERRKTIEILTEYDRQVGRLSIEDTLKLMKDTLYKLYQIDFDIKTRNDVKKRLESYKIRQAK